MKNKNLNKLLSRCLLIASCLWSLIAVGQSRRLGLGDVVGLAKSNSIASKQASTAKETAYWRWRTYRSDYMPQLAMDGQLPSFTRSFIEVRQPDGNIAFNPVSFNNSAVNVSLTQRIANTGGSIFLQHQFQRFDDFARNNTLYNGIPLAVGWEQPLLKFNSYKWEKQIEPLRYAESSQQFNESMEEIALVAVGYYFELLLTQVNLQIAQKNLISNDTLYKIALHKLELGKISQNDLLQLRLGTLNARKDLAAAEQGLEVASLQLRTFLGYRDEEKLDLEIPQPGPPFQVDVQKALQEAFANRPNATAFRRRLLEAAREVDRAKGDNGFNAALSLAFGLSNRGTQPGDIFRNPQDREFAQVTFSMPLVDWGRSKSRTQTAKANFQLTQQTVEQDKLAFEQAIFTQVSLVGMLQRQVKLTEEVDKVAAMRFQIAQDRFILGDLSITDLSIAIQEKDRAKRDYIIALRDYWRAYYALRWLTLYDFEKNQKIAY